MTCSVCGKRAYSEFCVAHKPRKPLKTTRIKPIGRVGLETAQAVLKWKQTQTPDDNGNYTCYICGIKVPYLMAEHVKSKARHPELRTDPNNLRPVCAECNKLKGSKDND